MEVRLDRDGRLRGVSSDLRERCCEDHSGKDVEYVFRRIFVVSALSAVNTYEIFM